MPNKQSAMKHLRQSDKRAYDNLMIKSDLKTYLRKVRKAVDDKSGDIEGMIKEAQQKVDKAVKKGIIKKNTGSRKLSRLMTYRNTDGHKKADETKKKSLKDRVKEAVSSKK